MARYSVLLLLCLIGLAGLRSGAAQRGFVSLVDGRPAPPSATCGNDCCPTNRICICGSCFPPEGPFPACAFPGPGIIYSCCDNVGAQCNRCNGECCLDDDVCSCKGFCISKYARGPACGPADYDDFGYPLVNCCEEPETGKRCSGRLLQDSADLQGSRSSSSPSSPST